MTLPQEGKPMDRYDAWQSNPLLPQIRRAAGLL